MFADKRWGGGGKEQYNDAHPRTVMQHMREVATWWRQRRGAVGRPPH